MKPEATAIDPQPMVPSTHTGEDTAECPEGSETAPEGEVDKHNKENEGVILESLSEEEIVEKETEAKKYKEEGNALYKEGDQSAALEFYSKAIDAVGGIQGKPEYAPFWGNRAQCYLVLGDLDECIADCNESLLLDDKYAKVRLRRAVCYEKKDMLDEALLDYKVLKEMSNGKETRDLNLKIERLEKSIKERNEKLQAEMLGKLKDLGNSVLGKFGMSMDNFKVQKDESTGSYSVNFQR
eukprot:Nk52_evm19s1401 gene=Nk52_evmTU19s1401